MPPEKNQWIQDNLLSWAESIDRNALPTVRAELFLKIVKDRFAMNAGNTSILPDHHGLRVLEEKLSKFFELKRLARVIYILEYYIANKTFDMPHPGDTDIEFYRQRFWEVRDSVRKIILQENNPEG